MKKYAKQYATHRVYNTIEYKSNEIQMSWPPPGPLATSLFSSCCLPSLHLLLLQVLLYLKHCQNHLFSCSSRPLTFMIIARILHLDNSPIVVRPVVEEYLGGRLARTCAHRCHRCVHLKGRSHSIGKICFVVKCLRALNLHYLKLTQ